MSDKESENRGRQGKGAVGARDRTWHLFLSPGIAAAEFARKSGPFRSSGLSTVTGGFAAYQNLNVLRPIREACIHEKIEPFLSIFSAILVAACPHVQGSYVILRATSFAHLFPEGKGWRHGRVPSEGYRALFNSAKIAS